MTDLTDDPVYAAIKERVVTFVFPQGERISVNSIAEELGVGSNPVRRVFHHLADEGLVIDAQKKGFYALILNEDDIRANYQMTRNILQLGLETLEAASVQRMPEYAPIATLLDELGRHSRSDFDFLARFTGELFASIVAFTKRQQLVTAISRENDHLRYVRAFECQRFTSVHKDLRCFCELFLRAQREDLVRDIEDYHIERLKWLPELIDFLNR